VNRAQLTTTQRGYGSTWQRLRLQILQRDRWRCTCGAYADTVDHVIPLAEGGAPYDPQNLKAACRHCNYADGGRLAQRRRTAAKFGVPSRGW